MSTFRHLCRVAIDFAVRYNYVFIVIPTLIAEVCYNTREVTVPTILRASHVPGDTASDTDHTRIGRMNSYSHPNNQR
jgi:hypothetical protein